MGKVEQFTGQGYQRFPESVPSAEPRPSNFSCRTKLILRQVLCFAIAGSSLLLCSRSTSGRTTDAGRPRYVKDVWQSEQGLPQDSVSAIAQTRDGYLWLGTNGGLARFDGVRFTVFEPGNTPGLAGNRITALFEDAEGRLWVGSESGVSVLSKGRFQSFTSQSGLPGNFVNSVCQDGYGTICVGTNSGLARFKGGKMTAFSFDGAIPSDSPTFANIDREGVLLVAVGGRIFEVRNGVVKSEPPNPVSFQSVSAIHQTRDGSIWIATPSYLHRLKGGKWESFAARKGILSALVRCLYEDREGNLWIGTDRGLNCWRNGEFARYTTEDGLSGDSIRAVAEDREGDIWIGTDGAGLDRWKIPRVTAFGSREGLPESSVVPILEDRNGDLWIGATCGGLIRFKDGKATKYGKADGLPNDCVWSLAEDRDGSLWVGTFGGGLARFAKGRFVVYGKRDGLPGDIVFSLFQDRLGTLWIGTDQGLGELKNGRLTAYTVKDGLVNRSVRFITEDRSGALWIGTTGGLSRLENGKFTSYTVKDGLSYDSVRAIFQDDQGTLWIGTYGGGLNRFLNGKFTRYSTQNGLQDSTVSRILEDQRGNLWLSGNNGISRVSITDLNEFADGARDSVSAVTYGVDDGMPSREATGGGQPAGWRTRDGKLWFPTIRGVVMVDPNTPNGPLPPVYVTETLVNNQKVDSGSEIELGPNTTQIEFHYTALSFQNPSRIRFEYRLDGYDNKWVAAGSRRAAYYTNLPPGSYRFRVIASNSDGAWNEEGASVSFRLKPHFYETIPFYVLALTVAVLGVWGLYRMRVARLTSRARELSLLVEQRTQAEAALRESNSSLEEALEQLHAAQQQIIQQERLRALGQMASGVAHDFNNALAPILGYSELLLVQPEMLKDRDTLVRDLKIINTAAKDAANVVRGLREFYRHREDGDSQLPVRLHEVIAQAISLTQPKWRNEARGKGVTITVTTDLQPVPPVPGNEADLREALINLIFNAIDAMPSGGTIHFHTRTADDQVILEVSDTGAGMSDQVISRCFEPFFTTKGEQGTGLGLARVYGTVQRHKGHIEVRSEVDRGTTFRIRLSTYPDPYGAVQEERAEASVRSLRVLVVDDEPQVRRLIAEYLAVDGHTAETASNGREALSKFREGQFDLVVTDMAMPEMNGDQLAEVINKVDPKTPIILLTGFGELINAAGQTPSGVKIVLSKPVGMSSFRQAVANAIGTSGSGS